MRITEITVTKLFGIFTHTIPLNLEEHITIIHGPNGFGKTIILKMLNGLFNGQYAELLNVPFHTFQVQFDDGSHINVIKEPRKQSDLKYFEDRIEDSEITISFLASDSTETGSFSLDSTRRKGIPLTMLEDMLPVERIGRDEWIYHLTREILSFDEVLNRFGKLLPSKFRWEEPDWWLTIQKLVRIHLIETQRLLNIQESDRLRKRPSMVPAVELYSKELAETIKQKLAESAALSQSLDRTFPTRLVEQMGQSTLTEVELKKKLEDLETKRSKLKEAGLLDKDENMEFLPAKEIGSNTKDVLSVYIQDVEKKLSVFDEIAAKIDLFRKIINQRFLYNRMTISKQQGFIFTLDDKPLPTSALSSGEQHELVLLYELLFKVEPNALILIDEPELSLHVAWQKQFLRDLQEITDLVSFDILIATHSPQIIHDRWDLTVELKGPK